MVNWCILYDMLSGICAVSYVGIRIDGSVGCCQHRDFGEVESLKVGLSMFLDSMVLYLA